MRRATAKRKPEIYKTLVYDDVNIQQSKKNINREKWEPKVGMKMNCVDVFEKGKVKRLERLKIITKKEKNNNNKKKIHTHDTQ